MTGADSEGDSPHNDAEWVRDSVIEGLKESDSSLVRSGAWLAAEDEDTGEIAVYRLDEVIEVAE